jgi:hypothetical protein
MPMPPYPVRCYRRGCQQLAAFKIAARWSDGITHELKTYALSCADCLAEQYRRSRAKQQACRLAKGETLETLAIFDLARGQRDQCLVRREDLERALAATA